jgi:hypothetical protein
VSGRPRRADRRVSSPHLASSPPPRLRSPRHPRGGPAQRCSGAAREAATRRRQLSRPIFCTRSSAPPSSSSASRWHRVRASLLCASLGSSRLRSQGSAAPAQVVTETLEAYGDDDDAIDVAKSGEQSCAGRAPTAACAVVCARFTLRCAS